MSKTILITGNAGQGKTTIAANVATVLARFGHTTLLLNADPITPKLHYHFGIQVPNSKKHRHSSGLRIQFKCTDQDKEPTDAETALIDVPAHDYKWYKTGNPTIIVTKPDFPSILETLKLTQHIPNIKGIIINCAEYDNYELSPGNIQHFLNQPIIGVIPYEKGMREALKTGHPLVELHPNSATTTILKKIAANLMNQQYHTT